MLNRGTRVAVVVMLAAATVVGCSGTDDEDAKQSEAFRCVDGESYEIGFEEPSALDVSAADVVADGRGEYSGTVRWADDTEAPLGVSVTYEGGAPTYTEMEQVGGDDLDIGCVPGVLRAPVRVEINSDDGRLAESWSLDLAYYGDPWLDIGHDLTGTSGTLDPESFITDQSAYEIITYDLQLHIDQDTRTMDGDISAWLKRPEANPSSDLIGPDYVVYSEQLFIAWILAEPAPES